MHGVRILIFFVNAFNLQRIYDLIFLVQNLAETSVRPFARHY